MTWTATRLVMAALIVITAARVLIGGFIEISSDESYYLLWAEHLDWSYYSKGPGVATVLAIMTGLLGKSALAIRCLAGLLGLAMSVVFLKLGTELYDRRTAIWALVILNVTPIFNAGGIILTIDPLMMFFWVIVMLGTWKAAQTGHLRWWVLTGLAMGLGFLCKYTILVLYPSIVAFLAGSRHRGELRRPGFYLMTALVLVSMTPVLIWNAAHEWITIRHLWERTGLVEAQPKAAEFPLKPLDFLEYLGLHAGVYSPLIFAGFCWTVARALRRLRASEEEWFLGLFSLPIILGYFLLSCFNAGEVNWTAPGFVGLSLLLVHYWPELRMGEPWRHRLVVGAFGIAAALTLFSANPDVLRTAGLRWPYKADPHWRLRGWRTLTAQLEEEIRDFASEVGGPVFVVTNRYQMAAPAAFYLPGDLPIIRPTPDHPVIHMRGEPGKIHNQFSFWPSYYDPKMPDGSQPYRGHAALYFTDEIRHGSPPREVKEAFGSVQLHSWFTVTRHGLPVRSWKVFACRDYRGTGPEK
ncbi:MAG: glycosyltransferase family 39 protein [Verrucomicrobia bacterium]|nr:glycosyltransferase family 39 protein [Verrucomicrobiota bacterium]